jgi:hypothetical protein
MVCVHVGVAQITLLHMCFQHPALEQCTCASMPVAAACMWQVSRGVLQHGGRDFPHIHAFFSTNIALPDGSLW